MGPIEYVEFAFDEHEICENFALVVFKYSSSVEDSIKLFHGTKLYGLPIATKNYSKHLEDPVFNEQLNYFKQLVNVERNNQSSGDSNKNRWNSQSSDNKFNIPDSLPEPPTFDVHNNINQNNYDCRSKIMPKHSHKVKSSRYQHGNHNIKHIPIDKSNYSHEFNRKLKHDVSSRSMEVSNQHQDSYTNKHHDRKHHNLDVHTLPNWNENAYYNQEPLIRNKKNVFPKRNLRDTMYQKRSISDFNYHNDSNTNIGCSSLLDLRDTINHSKRSKYDDVRQYYESNLNNQWSERDQKSMYSGSSYSEKIPRKNNNNSNYNNESKNRHQNHYYDPNPNRDRSSFESYQEYDNEYPNNYDSYTYSQEKNRPNNNYNNHMRHPNMVSSSYHRHSYHPYKQNDGHQKRNEYNRGRNNNK